MYVIDICFLRDSRPTEGTSINETRLDQHREKMIRIDKKLTPICVTGKANKIMLEVRWELNYFSPSEALAELR